MGSGQSWGGKLNASEGARMRNDSEDPLVQCKPPMPPELGQWFGNCLRCVNYPIYGGSETREFKEIFHLTFFSLTFTLLDSRFRSDINRDHCLPHQGLPQWLSG